MKISFIRGDDHEERVRFKRFNRQVDDMFFTVKDEHGTPLIKKRLNKGIDYVPETGKYHIVFVPKDTDGFDCDLKMEYDIQIIVDGKKRTIMIDTFKLKEDKTTPDCEV